MSKIQDGCYGCHFENLFLASSPAPKGQLTQNLVGGIGATADQKQLKSFRLEIQDSRHGRHQFSSFRVVVSSVYLSGHHKWCEGYIQRAFKIS